MSKRNEVQRRRQQLRCVAWIAVALATMLAMQPETDQLQRRIGLLLAATLTGYLMTTKRNARTTAKKGRNVGRNILKGSKR